MTKIFLEPIASESMGTRSMCTYIETPDLRLLIDPGVSMGRRERLLPHPTEYQELIESRKRIASFAEKSEVIAISHYHFDHYTPSFTDYVWTFSTIDVATHIYQDKLILVKDFRNRINAPQRRRGWLLQKTMGNKAKKFRASDGTSFTFGGTRLMFSEPVFHGERDTPLGWVQMLCIDVDGEHILHASDIQGPMLDDTLNIIMSFNPDLLYLAGPPLYLVDYRVDRASLEKGLHNLVKLAEAVPRMILDHHLVRDMEWRAFSEQVFNAAQAAKHKVTTAAEFVNQDTDCLESRRKQLYEDEPPSIEFLNWTKLPSDKRRTILPPV